MAIVNYYYGVKSKKSAKKILKEGIPLGKMLYSNINRLLLTRRRYIFMIKGNDFVNGIDCCDIDIRPENIARRVKFLKQLEGNGTELFYQDMCLNSKGKISGVGEVKSLMIKSMTIKGGNYE